VIFEQCGDFWAMNLKAALLKRFPKGAEENEITEDNKVFLQEQFDKGFNFNQAADNFVAHFFNVDKPLVTEPLDEKNQQICNWIWSHNFQTSTFVKFPDIINQTNTKIDWQMIDGLRNEGLTVPDAADKYLDTVHAIWRTEPGKMDEKYQMITYEVFPKKPSITEFIGLLADFLSRTKVPA
jgi:hypothetical protein